MSSPAVRGQMERVTANRDGDLICINRHLTKMAIVMRSCNLGFRVVRKLD
jgi:hypothetical protein